MSAAVPGNNCVTKSGSALETVFNDFTTALQSLSTTPDSTTARYGVLTAAQTLAQHLNGMTSDIQGMRSDAELALSDAVTQANTALKKFDIINERIHPVMVKVGNHETRDEKK